MIRALLILGAAAAGAYFYRSRRAAQRATQPPRSPEQEAAGVPNDVLAERVRAQLRGLVARPEAIQVHANAGLVTLAGTLTRAERDRVLMDVLAVPGVVRILNQTEVSDEAGVSPATRTPG